MNEYFVESVIDSQLHEIEEIRRLYDLFDVSFNNYIGFWYINYF